MNVNCQELNLNFLTNNGGSHLESNTRSTWKCNTDACYPTISLVYMCIDGVFCALYLNQFIDKLLLPLLLRPGSNVPHLIRGEKKYHPYCLK